MAEYTRKGQIASGANVTPLTREERIFAGKADTPLVESERVLSTVVGGGGAFTLAEVTVIGDAMDTITAAVDTNYPLAEGTTSFKSSALAAVNGVLTVPVASGFDIGASITNVDGTKDGTGYYATFGAVTGDIVKVLGGTLSVTGSGTVAVTWTAKSS